MWGGDPMGRLDASQYGGFMRTVAVCLLLLGLASTASSASYQYTPSAEREAALQFWATENGTTMAAMVERACNDGTAPFVASHGTQEIKRIADALKDPSLTPDEKKDAECSLKLRNDNCRGRDR
jgi:hypothetical protein